MAKFTPIRISQNDRKEHARLVRNARAKIRRTQKNHGIDLTDNVDLPKIDDFTTRKDFNEWKSSVSSFTNRYNLNYQFVTNEYNVTTTKAHINELTRMRKREQRVAQEEYERVKDKQIKQGGVPFATVEERTLHMSKPDVTGIHIPKDFDFSDVRSQRRLDEIGEMGKQRVEPDYYDVRQERMHENFMTALEKTFDNEADELMERLRKLPPDEFYHMYLENEEFDFDDYFYEDGEFVEVDTTKHISKMMAILDRYEEGDVNKDLRGF